MRILCDLQSNHDDKFQFSELLEFSEAGQREGRIKAASSNFQDKWRMEMVLKYNPPGSMKMRWQ